MLNDAALILSGLGIGGLLGIFVKSILDRRQLKFSKIFDYKETRYKAIMILMWVAMNPTKYELQQLRRQRPNIKNPEELDSELNLEYHNAMLFASTEVLNAMEAFMRDKDVSNWKRVVRAMKKDLYL